MIRVIKNMVRFNDWFKGADNGKAISKTSFNKT